VRKRSRGQRLAALAAFAVAAIGVPSAWAWTVTMDANPSLTRTYTWNIEKSVSQSSLTLKAGESATVTYSVKMSANAPVDSNWAVSGTMEMSEDPDITIGSVMFDVLPAQFAPSGIPASHSCMPMTFPVNLGIEGLTCTYNAALPDASPRWAHMKANVSAPAGTRQISTGFTFASATVNQVDECVNVTDTIAGALGTVCAADAPKTFTYSTTIGPYTEEECGEHTVDNTASFLTNDTGATGSSSASVKVTVVCEPPAGCTRTIGYWKTHAGFGPQADVVSPLLPIWLGTAMGAKSVNVTTAAKAVSILKMEGSNGVKDASNGINKLYAQLLGAKLNKAAGASTGLAGTTIAAADAFLASNNSLSWAGLSATQQATVNAWMEKLDSYNNGNQGVSHCK
jgi:hypothetical protein